jgi:hypothetical protein
MTAIPWLWPPAGIGATGPTGPTGAAGATGLSGPPGDSGDGFTDADLAAWCVPGPQGRPGVGFIDIRNPPLQPSADDDEFLNTTISPLWVAARADTLALITPTVGVDPFVDFATPGTAKWQQGYRDSFLALQSPSRDNNSHTADLTIWKSLATVGTNATFRVRWQTITENKCNRDGAFTFRIAADNGASKPDGNNCIFITGNINPTAGGVVTFGFGFTTGGVTTSTTWTWQADSNQKTSLWAPFDEMLIVKRGTQWYGLVGCEGRWMRITATGAIASQQYLSAITPAFVQMFFVCDQISSLNTPIQTIHLLDYFRRTDNLVIP